MIDSDRLPVEPPHADVDHLGDYLDGLLSAEQRDELDEHLALCAACRARLGALRLLVERAAHAAADIEPADDLWPGIHAAIDSRRTLSLPVGPGPREAASRRRWPLVAGTLAASFAVAAASALVTMRVVRSSPAPRVVERAVSPAPAGSGAADAAGAAGADREALLRYAALERDYDRSARELRATLDAQRDHLAPETIATVERSVATIDRAIAEARDALQRDPGNRVLLDMLTASHEQKLDLLRRAARLSTGA